MKIVLLVSLLLVCAVVRTNGTDILDILDELFPVVLQYLQTSNFQKYLANFTLLKAKEIVSNNDGLLPSLGQLNFSDMNLIGLEGLDTDRDLITYSSNKTESLITLGLNLSVKNDVGLQLERYSIDMVVIDLLPLYGNGSFKLTFYSIGLILNASFSYQTDTDLLHDFELRPLFSRATCKFDGFWRNDELSNFVSQIITGFLDLFVIFWNLEIDCISCMLSKAIQAIVNGKDILSSLKNCTPICLPSNYTIVETVFQSTPDQLMEYVSEDNIRQYVEIAAHYLSDEIDRLYL